MNTTVTYSYGSDYTVCASSMAILAWLRYKERFENNIESALKYLYSSCSFGRYGATHSTILALKAINAYEDSLAPAVATIEDIKLHTYLDDKLIDTKILPRDVEEFVYDYYSLNLLPSPGQKKYTLQIEGIDNLSFTSVVNFRNALPNNHANCCLKLETSLGKTDIAEGETTEVKVTVTNTDKAMGTPMVVVIVGLPGGLEPRYKHLKELVKSKTIDLYEVKDRWVVLYFLELEKAQVREVSFDVIASFPGSYTGEASLTYLYYSDEYKYYCEPLTINIEPQVVE